LVLLAAEIETLIARRASVKEPRAIYAEGSRVYFGAAVGIFTGDNILAFI
jgi:hypothetical protein